jgi:hypothetical protein
MDEDDGADSSEGLNNCGIITNTAAYESFSINQIPPEDAFLFGKYVLSVDIPWHRIFFPAFLKREYSFLISEFDDNMFEIVTISNGCSVRSISEEMPEDSEETYEDSEEMPEDSEEMYKEYRLAQNSSSGKTSKHENSAISALLLAASNLS